MPIGRVRAGDLAVAVFVKIQVRRELIARATWSRASHPLQGIGKSRGIDAIGIVRHGPVAIQIMTYSMELRQVSYLNEAIGIKVIVVELGHRRRSRSPT